MKFKILILTLFLSSQAFAESPAEKGLALAKKIDAANEGFAGESSELQMILLNAHGDKVERKLLNKIQENKNDGDQSIAVFIWPADVKDTKLLTWTHKNRNDDQWLYLPAIKRVKRITSNNKSGSFMGSEFSYEDFASQEVEKYTYNFIKDDANNGRSVWINERIPTDPKSGYSKQIVTIDQAYMNASKIDYYDRKGELLKTAIFSQWKQYGKYFRANKIEMKNHQNHKSSILTWNNRELFKKFPSGQFQSENLVE